MVNQISMMPLDKKFRRWVAKEIKNIFAENDTMEDAERMPSGCRADAERMPSGCRADAERMILFVVDNMLKENNPYGLDWRHNDRSNLR